MKIPKLNKIIFISFGILSITFGYIRLYFGVDFLDEAWYVSTIQQFALGSKPFLNEISLQQFCFILLSPIYKIFYNFNDFFGLGSVLFIRHVYILLVSLTALTTYKLLINFIPKSVSFALSNLFFVDVFVIPSISYNTVGRLMFTIGICLLVETYARKEIKHSIKIFQSVLSGLVLAVCFFSYLSLIIPIFSFFLITIIYLRKTNKKFLQIKVLILSFVLSCLFLFAKFVYPEIKSLLIDMEIIKVTGIYNLSILDKFNRIVGIGRLFLIPLVPLIILKIIETRYKNKLPIYLLLVFLIILFISLLDYGNPGMQYSKFVTLFSFIGLVIYPLFRTISIKNVSLIYFLVIIPIIIAGITTALTSANGYTNICVGISPGVIFTMMFLYKKMKVVNINYFVCIVFLTLASYTYLIYNTIYSETSFVSLTKKIESGPYKNLYTTNQKATFVANLEKEFINLDTNNNKTILCYYNFPACYLFSSLKMNFYSTWTMNWWMSKESFDRVLLLNSKKYTKYIDSPDVVFRYKYNDKEYKGTTLGDIQTLGYDPITELFNIDGVHYQIKNTTSDYIVFVKKDN